MGKNRLALRRDLLDRRLSGLSGAERESIEADLAAPPGGLAACQVAKERAKAAGRLRTLEAEWLAEVLDGWASTDLASRLVAATALTNSVRVRARGSDTL